MSAFRLPPSAFLLALSGLFLAGCPKPDAPEGPAVDRPALEGVTLRLVVVADPALAKAAGQARGEWTAQSGSELVVEQIDEAKLADADTLDADVLICPSHELGPLAQRGLIAPVPDELTDSAGWSDLFELVRLRETVWADSARAIPFGSPVFVCYYRADLLEKLGRRPPETWTEYQELAHLLADRKNLGDAAPPADRAWHGTIEPLTPGWGGLVLLARAAPYAKHPSNYSTLFDIATMEPLVAGEPLVRALEELVAAAKLGPAKLGPAKLDPAGLLGYDPAAVRRAFWDGRCGLALSWPTRAATLAESVDAPAVRAGLIELPGSREVYNRQERSWQERAESDDGRVPLLGIAGRIGLVARESSHPQAGFQLLRWLSENAADGRFSSASPATTIFRRSQVTSASIWVEQPVGAAAAVEYAEGLERTFRHEQWLYALRIPGRRRYLAALDDAVAAAVGGDKSSADALRTAADRWKAITKELGPKRQKAAYLASLGLD